MSTRAVYSFFGDEGAPLHVYKHHDGYPSGACEAITKALALAWTLPRFEADEFAAAFVAANKTTSGGIRLIAAATANAPAKDVASHFARDCEYRYEVRELNGKLHVTVFVCNYWDDPTETELFAGPLAKMSTFATKHEST